MKAIKLIGVLALALASAAAFASAAAAAPDLHITSPADNQFRNSGPSIIFFWSGNLENAPTCTLTGPNGPVSSAPCANLFPNGGGDSGTGQFDTVVTSQGVYSFTVEASFVTSPCPCDPLGTISDSVSFTYDSVPPAIALTSPADGATYGTTTVPIDYTVTGNDPGQATFCGFDGAPQVQCDGFAGTSPALGEGAHSFTVSAADKAGNSASATANFTAANIPGVSITAPTAGSLLNTTSTSVSFTTSHSPTSVTCKLDAAAATACVTGQSYSGLTQGSHTITVAASNVAGIGSASVTFTVDGIPPVVTITAPATGSTVASPSTLNFTATDATTTVTGTTCKLDAGAPAVCTTGQVFSGLTGGSHTIVVAATDQATNVGSATTTFTVAVIPVVTVMAPASGALLNTTGASVAFTATNSPTSVTCKLDAAAANACTSPQAYSGLTQGSHTITVAASNVAGIGSASVTFTVDSIPPVVTITSPASSSIQGATVPLTFTATDATTAVASTTCKLDAAAAGACPASLTGLAAAGHTLIVTAIDNAGNTGSATSTFTVAAVPVVAISAPLNNAVLNTTGASVAFTATNSPTSVTCKLDAAAATACVTGQSYSGLGQGSHTVLVTASNVAGSGNASVTFTVDSIPPVVTITGPAEGEVVNVPGVLSFTVTDAHPHASLNACSFDGGAYAACFSGDPLPALADGAHTVIVRGTDNVGNVGSATRHFSVDKLAPTLTITPLAHDLTNDPTPSIAFAVTDANDGAVTACKLETSVSYTPCTSPFTPAVALADGPHTVWVAATGVGGHTAQTPYTFVVDTVPPTLEITAPANGASLSTAIPAVAFAVSDGTAECSFDNGSFNVCSTSFTAPALANGSHTLSVRAIDAAGNAIVKTVNFSTNDPALVTKAAAALGNVLAATSSRPRHHRYTLTLKWDVQLPAGVSPATACQGDATLALKSRISRRRKVSKVAHVALAPGAGGCSVTAQITLKTRYRHRTKTVTLSFVGSSSLQAFTLTKTFKRP